MSFALYADHDVDGRIVSGLRLRGVDVITAREDGRAEESDSDLLDRATELGRIFVTHDKGFLAEAAGRHRRGARFYGIIYAPQRHGMIGRYIEDIEIVSELGDAEEFVYAVTVLPL